MERPPHLVPATYAWSTESTHMSIWNYIATKKKLDAAEQRIRHLELDLQLTAGAHRISIEERLALKDQLRSTFDLVAHIRRQRAFSARTFGPLVPGPRLLGVVNHIEKELGEIRHNPTDLGEWIDVIILGIDGASRAGHSPEVIVQALVTKQTKNENRKWPDWRTAAPDKAIEHVRTEEEQKAKEQEVPQTPNCPNGCGEPGPHFVPPSFSDPGFYICKPKG